MSQDLSNNASASIYPILVDVAVPAVGTLAFWFNPNGYYNAQRYSRTLNCCFFRAAYSSLFFGVYQYNGVLYAGWSSNGGLGGVSPGMIAYTLPATPFVSGWNLIVVTWNGSGQTLFINGVSVQTAAAPTTFSNHTAWYFGGTGNVDSCGGILSHVALWSSVLGGSEIVSMAKGVLPASIPSSAGRSQYFPFLQASGYTVPNLWGTVTMGLSACVVKPDPVFTLAFSQLPMLNSNGTTDDATTIQAFLDQVAAYGGSIVWDTSNACMKDLRLQSNTSIRGVSPGSGVANLKRYGDDASGINACALWNVNLRVGKPSRGTIPADGLAQGGPTPAKFPMGLGTAINSTGTITSMTLGTSQSLHMTVPSNLSARGPNAQPLYITLHDPAGVYQDEIFQVSSVTPGNDTITIAARACLGTTAQQWAHATTWASGGGLASSNQGPVIYETILDKNINITGSFLIDQNASSFTSAAADSSLGVYAAYGTSCIMLGGVSNVLLEGLTVKNSPYFGIFLWNAPNVYGVNVTVNPDSYYAKDGIHWWGPIQDCVFNGTKITSADAMQDNLIAINFAENDGTTGDSFQWNLHSSGDVRISLFNTILVGGATPYRTPIAIYGAAGRTGDILIDGLTLENITQQLVYLGPNGTGFGVQQLNSLTLSNITGTVNYVGEGSVGTYNFIEFSSSVVDSLTLVNVKLTEIGTQPTTQAILYTAGTVGCVLLGNVVVPAGWIGMNLYAGTVVNLITSAVSPVIGVWSYTTDPGQANVLNSATYVVNGVSQSGTYYPPNLDSNAGVPTSAAVIVGAHYGASNGTAGTASGGGLTADEHNWLSTLQADYDSGNTAGMTSLLNPNCLSLNLFDQSGNPISTNGLAMTGEAAAALKFSPIGAGFPASLFFPVAGLTYTFASMNGNLPYYRTSAPTPYGQFIFYKAGTDNQWVSSATLNGATIGFNGSSPTAVGLCHEFYMSGSYPLGVPMLAIPGTTNGLVIQSAPGTAKSEVASALATQFSTTSPTPLPTAAPGTEGGLAVQAAAGTVQSDTAAALDGYAPAKASDVKITINQTLVNK